MSNEPGPLGPVEQLVRRLRDLADAVTKGRDAVAREFTMRIPAEPERDADLVLSAAADEIERFNWIIASWAKPEPFSDEMHAVLQAFRHGDPAEIRVAIDSARAVPPNPV